MALLRKGHTKSQWTGLYHYGADSVPVDAAVKPTGVTTASGDNPTTSIDFNWTGLTDSPVGPFISSDVGPFSTGNERCEIALGGGITYVEGGVYWVDFYIRYINYTSISTQRDDWNYIMQHRSNGSTPSPTPCIAMFGANLIFRRNISGYGEGYDTLGAMDPGANWHHYQIGWKWSISATQGWVEAWRDGVNVVPRKAVRTAFDTSSSASLRFGYYRSPALNGSNRYYLWGLELHNSRPADGGAPPPAADTTGPTLIVTEPTSGATVAGTLRYTVTTSDSESGVSQVAYSLIGPDPATTVTTVFTETSAPWDDSDDFNPFDTATLADGDYTFRVVSTDVAGNATTVNTPITIANNPVIALPPTISIVAVQPTPTVGQTVYTRVSVDSAPNGGIVSIDWDLDNDGAFDDASDFVLPVPYVFTTPGPHIVRALATDAVGQTAVASFTYNVQEVTTDPGPDPDPDPPPPPPPPDPTDPDPTPNTRGSSGTAGASTTGQRGSSTSTGGLFPAVDLYPSITLYPKA